MGINAFDGRLIGIQTVSIDDSFGTGPTSMGPLGGIGGIITSFLVSNSDTVDHVVNIEVLLNGVITEIGSATAPASCGWDGNKSVDLLAVGMPTTFVSPALPPDLQVRIVLPVAVAPTFAVDAVLTWTVL